MKSSKAKLWLLLPFIFMSCSEDEGKDNGEINLQAADYQMILMESPDSELFGDRPMEFLQGVYFINRDKGWIVGTVGASRDIIVKLTRTD